MVTHFDATLGMGGWLDLTQPGLPPCKKYKTSWRSSTKSYRIIKLIPFPIYFNPKYKRPFNLLAKGSSRLLWWRQVDEFRNFCMSDETEKIYHKLEEVIGLC